MSGAIDPVDDERFLRLFKAAAGFRAFSPQLRELLAAAFVSIADGGTPGRVRAELLGLFTFLAGEGRTDANCSVTDSFFAAAEAEWRAAAESLPQDLAAFVADVSGALHDSIYAEPIARNFGATPEQMLERLLAIPLT